MTVSRDVIADLAAEGAEVDHLVADLTDAEWELPTPAEGWTIAHQVAHLAATFRMAATAAGQPALFEAQLGQMGPDFNAAIQAVLMPYLASPRSGLLAKWRAERDGAERALAAVPVGQKVPWLVRAIPAPVLAAAGMMELFGHGQDIADTLGVKPERTDRLEALVEFVTRVWDFGYHARGLAVPEVQFRFEITAPSGALWAHGPADAEQRISGPAADLCLLATRRRHRDDLALSAVGREADHWLDIAQCYRGPAGPGRTPGQFSDGR
ncbi:TIGR03084 family metal-binding protein [Saccharothrix sp. ST-888]|uniref:TIGR03084 family metal-binding protein n=1 Tax=Saccharothrix sp. ST-888 TaxID=1427391 RepID=UPI0005EC4FB1|nr:TIGR03084 family metal-binding protein [Saccharothrix sp. ST-888]KJK58376.1 wyosine base formation domain-containing protein [Saccharothrix sp. ST-888]